MSAKHNLRLYDEIMLLALREGKGTIETGAWYQQAVGGAVLAELVMEERLKIAHDGKKSLVKVRSRHDVGDELLDEWLDRIAADKVRNVEHWINKIAGTKDLKGRIARGLARRKILRVSEDKVLLFFSRKIYPEMDPEPERALRERLRNAVLSERGDVDARTSVLLSLAKGTGLIELVFDKKERKRHDRRIESIINGDACGAAVRDVVAATQVVMTSVVFTPTFSH